MSWARERPRDELRQDPTPGRAGRPSWRSSNSARTTRADRRVLAADPGGVRPGGVRPPGHSTFNLMCFGPLYAVYLA